MVQLNFNATGVKPNAALEALPSDNYPVVITKSEEKPTKANNGSYIEFEMTIQAGPFQGRKVFDRLNIRNPNSTAVDIAYATLSAICHVTGCLQLQDTAQLHGRPFIAVVKKVPRDDRPGEWSNEVKGYKDVNGNDPGFAGNAGAQTTAAPSWAGGAQQAPQQTAPVQQTQQQAPQGGAPAWAGGAQQQAPQVQQQSVQQQMQQAPVEQVAGQVGTPPPWAMGGATA